ncbi:MAG: transposase family protein [Bdellovibrionaceae bacterium]|nr:transposase family protein [Pseudobdellovibrionaceae bacterium]
MKQPSSYLKMQVLGAIDFAPGRTIRQRIRHVSTTSFQDEEGRAWRFTWRTIETWRSRYLKHGITSMQPKPRADKGKTRKVMPETLLEAIELVMPLLRPGLSPNRAQIYRLCIEHGYLRRDQVAPNTFSRLVKELDLIKPCAESQNKRRQAFSKAFANEMWQADTLFGPPVKRPGGICAPSRLIAFIDDASRVVTHAEFFPSESADNLVLALQKAIYKRGLPETLYVDNGSPYVSAEITLLCARLGILLCHTPVRDAAAKGKIERFFRTVRDNFLSLQLDLSSLEQLNRQLHRWVEEEYNARPHSAIHMRPIDRFGLDLRRIRFLPPNPANDELFFLESQRQVRADNTFSFQSKRFETPADLRNQTIAVRYPRGRLMSSSFTTINSASAWPPRSIPSPTTVHPIARHKTRF